MVVLVFRLSVINDHPQEAVFTATVCRVSGVSTYSFREIFFAFPFEALRRCFRPELFTAQRFRGTFARGTAVDGWGDAF